MSMALAALSLEKTTIRYSPKADFGMKLAEFIAEYVELPEKYLKHLGFLTTQKENKHQRLHLLT